MAKLRTPPTSTVGRNRKKQVLDCLETSNWSSDSMNLFHGDVLDHYKTWPVPTVIISDGGYGVLGFEGDTADHLNLDEWYEPHIKQWSEASTFQTTLWFWNSEVGWAAVHPILEKYGWKYVSANIWDKGKGHIAGNINTKTIRRFPVVTEVCVQYVLEPNVRGKPLKEWLLGEWKRTGLALRKANEACDVKDVAVRKYFDQGHLWYSPPADRFEKIQAYANKHGNPEGAPYYVIKDKPATAEEWGAMRSKFNCPHGYTNVWTRSALRGKERVTSENGKAIHLNQKPLDLMKLIIESTSDVGDTIWEPFGGLFSGSLAAHELQRVGFSAELDDTYYHYGLKRVKRILNTT